MIKFGIVYERSMFMTDNWRLSIAIPKELEERIIELRKDERFCRMSYSELVRHLIVRALEADKKVS